METVIIKYYLFWVRKMEKEKTYKTKVVTDI